MIVLQHTKCCNTKEGRVAAMERKRKIYFVLSGILLLAFALFTVLVTWLDVQSVGPGGSSVGFAGVNAYVFRLTGVHLAWYHITDWLGIVAILTALAFAAVGLYQLIKRKSLWKVDRSILALGVFYGLVIAFYLFFEKVIINCRPILMNGQLEASYPSSHTMIVLCITATAAIELHHLCPNRKKLCVGADIAMGMIAAITVIGRLISGVHWFTDIVGGILLASALVAFYCAVYD